MSRRKHRIPTSRITNAADKANRKALRAERTLNRMRDKEAHFREIRANGYYDWDSQYTYHNNPNLVESQIADAEIRGDKASRDLFDSTFKRNRLVNAVNKRLGTNFNTTDSYEYNQQLGGETLTQKTASQMAKAASIT